MAEIGIIPLLNAQQLSMIGLAHDVAMRPEVSQAAAREMALALLRQEAKQVEKSGAGDRSTAVHEDNGTGGRQAGSFRREKRHSDPDADENSASPQNPLVGNLLNVTV